MIKKFLLLTVSVFSLCSFLFADDDSSEKDRVSIISIESAEKSEYKKDQVSGGDCIVLTGTVVISVSRGNDKTTISADRVNYNRTSEMLYAEGNVALEQSGGSSGGEKITADSLLFNTSTFEGIFDNGRAVQTSSDAINLPSGSTLIVASDIFGRDSGGTIAFKNGELTFCDDENPHWKIRARRIWLLPGGEFAFLGALLYVGRVPLVYLPAFYYPKDELIFNPAMGYKNREGYFINTTTYLYGRKPADAPSTNDSSSDDDDEKINPFSFMKTGAMKEQVREGIVLHNLDADFSGDTTNHVKIMADYYANLGTMVGTDVVIKPKKYFSEFSFNTELGFSNTVFQDNSLYTAYNSAGDKVSDSSNFMGMTLPFRYQANLKLAITTPFSLSLSMPLYSDPYFDYDFNNRAETMDWIDFLISGIDTTDEDDVSTISSFSWNFNGSYTFKLPDFIKPYVSSLSVSKFASSIAFSSISADLEDRDEYKADSYWKNYTPERYFYYPSSVTPFSISTKISGTLIEYPRSSSTIKKQTTTLSLLPPADLDTEEKKDDKTSEEGGLSENAGEDTAGDEEENKILFDESVLPVIATTGASSKNLNGITYKLGYSISPEFTSQLLYSSENLSRPEDFDWQTIRSTYVQVKSPATLTSSLGIKDNFLSLSDTFTFNPVYQMHPYMNSDTSKGGYSESSMNSIKKADYNARKLDLTDTNALTFKPFYYTEHFSNTAVIWNTTVKMIQTKYISDDVNNPEWEYLTMDLTDEDCVTTHNLNTVLAANEGDFSQQLSLTMTLPPQVDSYSGVLTLGFPYTTFSVGTGIKEKSSTDSTWVKNDVSQSLAVKLFNSKLTMSQSYVYDWEEEEHDSFKFSLSGYGAQLAYTMSYSTNYKFEKDGDIAKGWVTQSDKSFHPYSLSFAYATPSKTFKKWTDRISFAPSLSTSLVYDFLRPTSSYFVFIPKLTFKVNNFLDLSFSSESRNSVIYRYFCPDSDYEYYYNRGGERSFFTDLLNSFAFNDTQKRKDSGFKLKSLVMSVTHDLDDWDFNCSLKLSPRYNSTTRNYDFKPYFSLSVSWRPMSGMKTEILDEYGTWSLE